MRERKCLGAYDLFVLKYDLVLGLHREPTGVPAPTPTKKTLDKALEMIKEFKEREFDRVLPENYSVPATAFRYELLWDKLIAGHKEYFRKHKYLPVRYDPATNQFAVVIPPKGRPKKNNRKSNKVDLRLDDDIVIKLDNYCEANNIKRSEAIRQALELLLNSTEEKTTE